MFLKSARAAGRGAKQWRNPPVQPRFGGQDLRVFLKKTRWFQSRRGPRELTRRGPRGGHLRSNAHATCPALWRHGAAVKAILDRTAKSRVESGHAVPKSFEGYAGLSLLLGFTVGKQAGHAESCLHFLRGGLRRPSENSGVVWNTMIVPVLSVHDKFNFLSHFSTLILTVNTKRKPGLR